MYGPASVLFFCRLKLTRLGQSRDSHTQSERLDIKTFSISHNERLGPARETYSYIQSSKAKVIEHISRN